MQIAYPSGMADESPRRLRRRQKLEQLLIEVGGPAKASQETGTPKSHFSAMLAGRRGVGDALAAKLEDAFGKPAGWFDQDADVPALSPDVMKLAMLIEALPPGPKRKEALQLCGQVVELIQGSQVDRDQLEVSTISQGQSSSAKSVRAS